VVPPGHSDETFHSHGEAVHCYISGEGQQIVGDQELEVSAGDLAFIPAGVAHGIRNSTGEAMRVVVAEQMPGTYLQKPVIGHQSA